MLKIYRDTFAITFRYKSGFKAFQGGETVVVVVVVVVAVVSSIVGWVLCLFLVL